MPIFPPFDYISHIRTCARKQQERLDRIAALPPSYKTPITDEERKILGSKIENLVKSVKNGTTSPKAILEAYGKAAILAHEKTNCLTEIMIPYAIQSLDSNDVNLQGPLAGIPISLKDTIHVRGYDSSVGYSFYADDSQSTHTAATERLATILKRAGAIPFVKTNCPTTLLSFESSNDVWGRSRNPHSSAYTPGGSTGGEAALLAAGGSRIGVGSDVAGSVRLPAHWSGCCALRCSTMRWPRVGAGTSMAGQEGVMAVVSPMARTMGDLAYFAKSILGWDEVWKIDPSIVPLGWRGSEEEKWQKANAVRVGVMWDDGVVTPTPACARALRLVADALRNDGHQIKSVDPPEPYRALKIASQLLISDGGATYMSHFRTGESNDPGVAQLTWYMKLPSPIRYLHYLWIRYVKRDTLWADLLRNFYPKTNAEQWLLVAQRESYRQEWSDWWHKENIDILITVPNASPALPHKAMHDAVSSCGYTFLFNLLDYSAGVLPVTKVDTVLDALPKDFNIKKLNGVARGAYKFYDAEKMKGLPVGVQIVGRRWEEEKVIAIMTKVNEALKKNGTEYQLLEAE